MDTPSRKKHPLAGAVAPSDDAGDVCAAPIASTPANDPEHEGRMSPPILPFRYFKLAIERLKASGNLPHRIDRSAWSTKQFRASGVHIAPAFQFLRLIDEEGRPLDALVATIASAGTDNWRERLGQVLLGAYSDVLAIGIDKATPRDILQLFRRHYGMDAAHGRMAASFFVHAAREAQIDVGPFLSATIKPPLLKPRISPDEFRTTMLARLPPFEETWSDELKLAWLTAFNELAAAQR